MTELGIEQEILTRDSMSSADPSLIEEVTREARQEVGKQSWIHCDGQDEKNEVCSM